MLTTHVDINNIMSHMPTIRIKKQITSYIYNNINIKNVF